MKAVLSTLRTVKHSTCRIGILPVKKHVNDYICIYKVVFLHY